MADPATTPASTPGGDDEPSGRTDEYAVDQGNDAFTKAFASFAAGNAASKDADQGASGDDADLAGAADHGDEPSSNGDAGTGGADAPGDAPAAREAPDPWANASPELLAARDKMRAEYDTKVARAAGRASGLQRQLNELTKPKAQAGGEAGKSEPTDAWKALDGKIKQLREDYPEIADVLVPLLEQQRDGLAALSGRVAPVIESDNAESVVNAQQALATRHPDWGSYGDPKVDPGYDAWLRTQPKAAQDTNTAFNGWLSAQPKSIQDMARSWHPDEAAVPITLFKTERAEAMKAGNGTDTTTGGRRARQLDGGAQVGSRPASAATGAPDDDFAGAFEHFARKKAPAR